MHILGGPPISVDRPQRYVLPLLERRSESPSAMTFRFSTEGKGFRYQSQQAIRVALPGVDDPWGAVRTFSLSSSPSEPNEIAVTVRITDTPFKEALARMRPGDRAEVFGPLGLFLLDRARPSVFLAGGIGVTPFRGMLHFSHDSHDTLPRRLLYSARTPEELLFRDDLDRLAAADPSLQVQYTVTRRADSPAEWSGRVGRIDEAWVRAASEGLDRPMYYVAGLPEMVAEMLPLLQGRLGVPEADIDYEVFRGF